MSNFEKIEFYKEKEAHRKEERKNLPPFLQLEFPQQRPEKEKWSFEGKLLKLRKSGEPADKLFIEDLRMKTRFSHAVHNFTYLKNVGGF